MKSLIGLSFLVLVFPAFCLAQRNPAAVESKWSRARVETPVPSSEPEKTASVSQPVPELVKKLSKETELPLRIIKQPRASDPPQDKGTICVRGSVLLKVEFREDSTIGKVVAVRGLPHGLTEQAISAARKIEFIPAIKGGVAVTKIKTLEYSFSIY